MWTCKNVRNLAKIAQKSPSVDFCKWLWIFWLFIGVLSATEPLTIAIPMRDGTKLPTDLYFPPTVSPEQAHLPCILVRAPSGRKNPHAMVFSSFANEGYVVAVQDTRSILDKVGKTFPYLHDGWGEHQDGYDTIEWLAKSSYTNGRIGTAGASAQGMSQLMLAPTAPPSLQCQYICVAASNMFSHAVYPGGQLLKSQIEGWLGFYAKDPSILNFARENNRYNPFWEQFNAMKVAERVRAPAVHLGGWYDTFLQGTIDGFVARQGCCGGQKLVIGPWQHYWHLIPLGDVEVPERGQRAPIDLEMRRWFAHYLKDEDNGSPEIPVVTYYVMGPFDGSPSSGNVWRSADTWPPPHTVTNLSFQKDHALTSTPSEEAQLTYTHDPQNPVPTRGGRNLFLESGPKDQRDIEARDDVLVFTTEPFSEDVEVTGPLSCTLYLSAPHEEVDVAVRLTDVYPDGRSLLITDGLSRLKDGEETLHKTGQGFSIRRVPVDLWSTSIVFAKGHRLRLSIAGSNYPRYEKMPYTADKVPSPVTEVALSLGPNTPSQLQLPLVQ